MMMLKCRRLRQGSIQYGGWQGWWRRGAGVDEFDGGRGLLQVDVVSVQGDAIGGKRRDRDCCRTATDSPFSTRGCAVSLIMEEGASGRAMSGGG